MAGARSGAGALERTVVIVTLLAACLLAFNLGAAQRASFWDAQQAAVPASAAEDDRRGDGIAPSASGDSRGANRTLPTTSLVMPAHVQLQVRAAMLASAAEAHQRVDWTAAARRSRAALDDGVRASATSPTPSLAAPAPAQSQVEAHDPASWRCERRLERLGLANVADALRRGAPLPKLHRLPGEGMRRAHVGVPPGPRLSAASAPPCVFLAFFHFDKAGGTVLRQHLERLGPRCSAEKDPSGEVGFCGAPSFVQLAEHNFSWWGRQPDARRQLPRVWIEAHAGKFHELLAKVRALRERLGGACTVLTATAIREPVEQLRSAYRYWALGQNDFHGSLLDYALNLGRLRAPRGSAEGAHAAARGSAEGARADWFYGRVKFSMLKRHGAELTDLNPCNQPRGSGCNARCYALLNGFFAGLDIVAPTDEWETLLLQLAAELRLAKLPIHFKAPQCSFLLYQRLNSSVAPPGLPESGFASGGRGDAASARAGAAAEIRAALLPSVPCSARLYAEWRARYVEGVAARMWADEATRESVCALEAQYTCHLHHGRLNGAEGAAMRSAMGALPQLAGAGRPRAKRRRNKP